MLPRFTLLFRCTRVLAAAVASPVPFVALAAAQSKPAAAACATAAGPSAPNTLSVPATCGTITFPVDADLRQHGQLHIAVRDGNLFVRTLTLEYASTGSGPRRGEVPLRRLLGAGETTAPFATSREGLNLVSVSLQVNPATSGSEPATLALVSPSAAGAAANATRSAARPASVGVLATDEWVLAGSVQAHLSQLRDTISIGRGKGRFDQLVISSRDADLPVQSVQVVPVTGAPFAAEVRTLITAGTVSQMIALNPPDFIREVTVTYGTPTPQPRTPTVEVRARYAESWRGKFGENRQYAGGWVLLGTVDVVAMPHTPQRRDLMRIQGQEGPFKRVRLVARRGAVDMVTMTVDAGDGRTEALPVNAVLMPDKETAPFAFTAGPMPLAAVTLTPRIRPQSRIDATVEVWAQY